MTLVDEDADDAKLAVRDIDARFEDNGLSFPDTEINCTDLGGSAGERWSVCVEEISGMP